MRSRPLLHALVGALTLGCGSAAPEREVPEREAPEHEAIDGRAECLRAHPVDPEHRAVVRALCSELQSLGGLSGSVVIARGDEVVFELAHGTACGEAVEPLTTGTTLRIGSITKPITAALALEVARRRGIELDAPLVALPELEPAVTLRELLSHTSGLRDPVVPATLLSHGDDWPRALAKDRQSSGSHRYANANYLLVGAWLERETGQSFASLVATEPALAAVRERVSFDPATVRQPGCVHRWAMGWWPQRLGTEPPLPAWTLPAGGGLASTADLARLPEALRRTGWLDTMIAHPVPTDRSGIHYGLGLRVQEHDGVRVLAHAGRSDTGWAELWWAPDRGISVAVMSSTPQALKATLLAAFDVALRTSGAHRLDDRSRE